MFHFLSEPKKSNFYDRGFFAGDGWDPVTGLGNPNFPPLVDLAVKAAMAKVSFI